MSFTERFRKIRALLGGIVFGPVIYLVCQRFIPGLAMPKGSVPAPLDTVLPGLLNLLTLPVTTIFGIKGISIPDMIYWGILVWFSIWANDIRPPKKRDPRPFKTQ